MSGRLVDEVWATSPDWPARVRVMPDGGADLIWTGDELIVAGPDRVARLVTMEPGAALCGVRFLPGAARAAFGWSGEALADATIPAAEVLGTDEAGRLSERLASAPTQGRPRLLAAWAVSDARAVARRDRTVAYAADRLARDPTLTVSAIAAEAGYSDRQLRRRIQSEVGYSPKRLARILRLRRVMVLAAADPALSLADLAYAGGFVDQSHLSHECSGLGGTTAGLLLHR